MSEAGKSNEVSRRTFLGNTAVAAAASVAAPYVITSGVLAAPGRPGPNDRINIALIGANGQGNYDLGEVMKQPDTSIVAVCEVDKGRRDADDQPRPEGRHQARGPGPSRPQAVHRLPRGAGPQGRRRRASSRPPRTGTAACPWMPPRPTKTSTAKSP